MHCAPSSKSNTAKRRMHFHFSARPCSRILSSQVKKRQAQTCLFLEVTPGVEPGNQGFADPCLTTWLCHHRIHLYYMQTNRKSPHLFLDFDAHTFVWASSGAGNEARTRYLHLGKVALYQMSYARRWCPEPESNQRHVDFQSTALPTELSGQIFFRAIRRGMGNFNPRGDPRDGNSISWEMATRNGLEPSTSSVTG